MKWSIDADHAIKKVPFFVRKKVRQKVENYVKEKGKKSVELSDVDDLRKKFLSKGGMEKEIKGYEVATCFGGSTCPNSANSCAELAEEIEKIFKKADILGFLKKTVPADLKFHHEFKVSLSDCPNACSRVQIADIGIIGAAIPALSKETCLLCNACVEICNENAIRLDEKKVCPIINYDLCLMCGQCADTCPSKTIINQTKGFRVMLAGRLGRHPRLAMEIPGIKTHSQVIEIVKNCIKFYKKHSNNGTRFSNLLTSIDQIN
jgi:dissimilatory sulfite reductase (desulfoviridin) alpha/beta subunit